jgi:asparagine synthase (glutamine-hydrolysing)
MIVVNNGNPTVIRDPYGVRPLFMEEKDAFASEAKALPNLGGHIQQFPAGTFFQNGRFRSYHEIPYIKQPFFKNTHSAEAALHDALTTSVKKRLLSDRPIGALLSGGLDSSLIVAILSKHVGNLQQNTTRLLLQKSSTKMRLKT